MKAIQYGLLLLAAIFLSACGGAGSSGGSASTTLISVSISPNSVNIPAGIAQQYGAQATYSDGTTKTIAGATFASSNTTVATVDTVGSAQALSAGTTNITATFQGKTASVALHVTSAALLSISISPATAIIPVSTTQQFTATGNYSDGSNHLISAGSWSTSSSAVASIDSAGLATGVSAGNANITFSFNGQSATASLYITTGFLQSLTIAPVSASIVSGTTQQYSVTGNYSDGSTLPIANATWTSSLTSVATIDSSGLATSTTGSGSTSITATYGGKSASTTLTVTPATAVSLSIVTTFGDPTTLPINTSPLLLSASITYSNGTKHSVSTGAVWSSSNTAVATIWGNSGIMPVDVGSTTITVTDAGLSGTLLITYTSPVAVSTSITGMNASTNSYSKRSVFQLSALINFSKGPSTAAVSTTWSSSNTSVFKVDANGLLTGVGAGSAVLSLYADGFYKTRSITMVNPAPTPVILVKCNSSPATTLSAAEWNADYASDPKNTTEWVGVDPVSCAGYPYLVLVVTAGTNHYAILDATNSGYGAGYYGPAITSPSSFTPQLSSGVVVDVGYKATATSFFYTTITSFTVAP